MRLDPLYIAVAIVAPFVVVAIAILAYVHLQETVAGEEGQTARTGTFWAGVQGVVNGIIGGATMALA